MYSEPPICTSSHLEGDSLALLHSNGPLIQPSSTEARPGLRACQCPWVASLVKLEPRVTTHQITLCRKGGYLPQAAVEEVHSLYPHLLLAAWSWQM